MPLPLRFSTGTVSDAVLAKINASSPVQYPTYDRAIQIVAHLDHCLYYDARERNRAIQEMHRQRDWAAANSPTPPTSPYLQGLRGSPHPADYSPLSFIPYATFLDDIATLATHPSEKIVRLLSRDHGAVIASIATGAIKLTSELASASDVAQLNAALKNIWPMLVVRAKQDQAKYEHTMLLDDLHLLLESPQFSSLKNLSQPEYDLSRTAATLKASSSPREIFTALKAFKSIRVRHRLVQMNPSITTPEAIMRLLSPKTPDDDLLASIVESQSLPQESVALIYARIESEALADIFAMPTTAKALSFLPPPPGYLARLALYCTGSFARRHSKLLANLVSHLPWHSPNTLPPTDRCYNDLALSCLDAIESMPSTALLNTAYGDRLVDVLIKSLYGPDKQDLIPEVRCNQFASLTRAQYARLSASVSGISAESRSILLKNLPLMPTSTTITQ